MNTQFLSVHTEDRDISKWPNNNHFSVIFPVEYKNVACIKLEQIELPCTQYAFRSEYGNTTLLASLNGGPVKTVTIANGTYRPSDLATELQSRITTEVGTGISVVYNPIQYKFIFTCAQIFTVSFLTSNVNHTDWGMGSNLGFSKKAYTASYVTTSLDVPLGHTTPVYRIMSDTQCFVYGHSHIYMEIDQYNTMDEIEPYTYKSNLLVHSRHSGKHNASFAKISILPSEIDKYNVTDLSPYWFVNNPYRSDPPVERIQKLTFKFRYHDGRLIDFGNVDFSFTLSFLLDRK